MPPEETVTEDIEDIIADSEEMSDLEGLGRRRRLTRAQINRLRFLRRRRRMTMMGFEWPLWDSAEIATTGTTELTLFQEPKGQSGKTPLDTNMKAAGLITTGDYYDMRAIGVTLKDAVATQIPPDELREILYFGLLELYISDRLAYESLLIDLPFGGGPWASGSAAAATEMAMNGFPSQENQHYFKKVIRIPRNVHFMVKLLWPTEPTPTTAIKAIVRMQGVLWRRRT